MCGISSEISEMCLHPFLPFDAERVFRVSSVPWSCKKAHFFLGVFVIFLQVKLLSQVQTLR
jgi:hypothetical protein